MEERIDVINGKRVKVTIKNLTKNTSACDVCRERKKKCDGKAPCSYCVANNKVCQFSQRRKRGPKFKATHPSESTEEIHLDGSSNITEIINQNNTNNGTVNINGHRATNNMIFFNAATSRYECEIIDKLEGNAFKEFYLMFVNPYMHLNPENIMSPVTVAHRAQAYSALAMAARLCGDRSKAQMYMSQARVLAGTVFDSPNADTVAAMLMLAQFCRLTLDIPLYKYYCHIAYGLTRVGPNKIQGKLGVSCEMYNILSKEELSQKQKATLIKQALATLETSKDLADNIYMLFCVNAANFLETCSLNIVQPDITSLQNCFYLLQGASISNGEREDILRIVDMVRSTINGRLEASTAFGKSMKALYVNNFYCPVYTALAEWKSGHYSEALSHALVCMDGLQKLYDAGFIAVVAKPTHVSLMGTLVSFFYEQGLHQWAAQMCKHIQHICDILSPEYDFLRLRIDDYVNTKLTNTTNSAILPYQQILPNISQPNIPNTTLPSPNEIINNSSNNNINNTNNITFPPNTPTSQSLSDNYSYSYMDNDLNMNVMDMNVVNLIDLSAVEGMWVNVMNS